MKPQHWQEIDRIFAAALELEPAERAGFLDDACAGDEQLRKEVELLLAHDLPASLLGGRTRRAIERHHQEVRLYRSSRGQRLQLRVQV